MDITPTFRPGPASALTRPAVPVQPHRPDRSQAPVDNITPETWLHRDPAGLALGAGVGAMLGSLAGGVLSGVAAAGLGGALGAVAGGLVGRLRHALLYDVRAQGREWRGLASTQRGRALHWMDEAWRSLRGARPALPLVDGDRRASGRTGDGPRLYDGYDSSRDLASLSSREGGIDQLYRFQIELAHLRPGAEHGHLDTELLVDWDGPGAPGWKASVRVRDDHRAALLDASGGQVGAVRDVEHSTRYSHVAFGLDKADLRRLGWKDGQALRLRAQTTRDGDPEVRDRLDARTDVLDAGHLFRWEGRTVYYAMTDRFRNGDPTNDQGADPTSPNRFHGGDWQGLIDSLDYLDGLGVDCLWLSCPYENDRGFFGSDGYHGYWPHDFRQTEPSFGSLEKLRELTQEAHRRGMKVMLDVVVNHTGYEHPDRRDPSKREWFHREGGIKFLGQHAMEHGSLAGLPDLAQENPEVAAELVDVHRHWLESTGVDAFRVDAVRHVPETFLRHFNDQMHQVKLDFLSLGEAFRDSSNYVAGFQNRSQDSMFDVPLAFAIRDVFASDPERTLADRWHLFREMSAHNMEEARRLLRFRGGESMRTLARVLARDASYDNPLRLSTFLDNHDMGRFMSDCAGDQRKLRLAASFLMACRGMPTLYYGTEVAMDGRIPENRKDMAWGSNPVLTAEFQRLMTARGSSAALQTGTHQDLSVDRDTYAFARVRPGEEVLCTFNNAEEARTLEIPLAPTQVPEGAVLVDMLGGSAPAQAVGGVLRVTLPAKGSAWYRWAA